MNNILEMIKNEKVEWKKISQIIFRHREKQRDDKKIKLVYTVSKEFGLISSDEYWIKNNEKGEYTNYSQDISNYNIIRKNMFAYNPSRLNIGSIDCLLDKPEGVLSPMYVIFKVDEKIINPRYLLYYLKSEKILELIDSKKEHGARFRFDFERWAFIKIPLPSIETQEKIVEILDNFREYNDELQAELQNRSRQYEYFRDLILSEDYLNKIIKKCNTESKISYFKLKELVDFIVGGDVPKNQFSKMKTEKYKIPIYSNGTEENSLYGYTNIARVLERSITISARGTIGYVSIKEEPYYPIVRLICLIPKSDKLNLDYLYYYLQQYKFSYVKTGIPSLTRDMISNIELPLPNIEIQNKVVEVLDKFQNLISDAEGLLPEEIEQRQKQYEYYREKLLTFENNMVQVKSSQVK